MVVCVQEPLYENKFFMWFWKKKDWKEDSITDHHQPFRKVGICLESLQWKKSWMLILSFKIYFLWNPSTFKMLICFENLLQKISRMCHPCFRQSQVTCLMVNVLSSLEATHNSLAMEILTTSSHAHSCHFNLRLPPHLSISPLPPFLDAIDRELGWQKSSRGY